MEKCPKINKESEASCEKKCEKAFEAYTQKLEHRYKNENQQKIDEIVENAPSFTTQTRKDRPGFWGRYFQD